MRFIERESVRYVLAGGFNTVSTYAAYLVLLPLIGYVAAYSLTYAAGILLAYYLSAQFVFRRPLNWQHAIQYPLVYVVQYGLGLVLTAALIEVLHLDAKLVPALVIVLTLPFTFWMSRWIVKRRKKPGAASHPSLDSEGRAAAGREHVRFRRIVRGDRGGCSRSTLPELSIEGSQQVVETRPKSG